MEKKKRKWGKKLREIGKEGKNLENLEKGENHKKKLPSVITSFVSFSLLRYPIKTLRPHPAISPISGLKPPSSIGVLVTSSFLLLKILVLTPGTDLPVVSNLMYLKEKKNHKNLEKIWNTEKKYSQKYLAKNQETKEKNGKNL